ncbi:hypothetical protein GJAV_G00132400 [Gymnothorax javanicus]|nr:hypothetical protein GJAV_G00132400 [Gymnothorax javanicus]
MVIQGGHVRFQKFCEELRKEFSSHDLRIVSEQSGSPLFEVKVNGELVHSRKRGDGFVDALGVWSLGLSLSPVWRFMTVVPEVSVTWVQLDGTRPAWETPHSDQTPAVSLFDLRVAGS